MTKSLRIFLLIILGLVIGGVLFFYFAFAGFPWKKITVGNATLKYLEEKYDEKFVIEDRYYNFKDGKYEIKAYPVKDPNMIFNAGEGWGNKGFFDYYPEAVWEKQANADFKGIVKDIFPDMRHYRVHTVYGEGMELVKELPIPYYIEIGAYIDVAVNLPWRFQETDEEFEKILTLIQFIQKNGGNIHIFIAYEPREDDAKNVTYITLSNEEIKQIHTIEDIKKVYNK